MASVVAECRDVVVCFGTTRALDGLDLDLAAGRITALVGPNGAGKTTTLRLLAGLVPRQAGDVRVFGLDPWRDPVNVRRRLGFLPDRPMLPRHLSVRELIRLRAALFGVEPDAAEGRARAVHSRLGVADLVESWCGALSHGQAQRVALAAVLVSEPDLLLVDEPMTALDLEAQMAVREELAARAEAGAAVVITTHTVAHVATLASRVVRLDRGRTSAERDGCPDVGELERWMLGSGPPGP